MNSLPLSTERVGFGCVCSRQKGLGGFPLGLAWLGRGVGRPTPHTSKCHKSVFSPLIRRRVFFWVGRHFPKSGFMRSGRWTPAPGVGRRTWSGREPGVGPHTSKCHKSVFSPLIARGWILGIGHHFPESGFMRSGRWTPAPGAGHGRVGHGWGRSRVSDPPYL